MKCVEVRDLSVEDRRGRKILDSVSFDVSCGEFVVVSGPSGGGKSTLIKILVGAVDHLSNLVIRGDVKVLGIDVLKSGVRGVVGSIGVVLQNPVNQVYMFTVEEEIAFPLENLLLHPDVIRSRVEEAIETLGLGSIRSRSVFELSMGQLQRVVLASVLGIRPRVLVMDEPCSYIDPLTKAIFYRFLGDYQQKTGATVLVVEHDLEYLLDYATRLMVLDRKVVAYDDPLKVFDSVDAESYGIREPVHIRLCRELGLDRGRCKHDHVAEYLREHACGATRKQMG